MSPEEERAWADKAHRKVLFLANSLAITLDDEDARELAELVIELNDWIAAGGALPSAWRELKR